MIVCRWDLQQPVKSVPITINVVRSNPVHGEVYSIQHYVIKFVSDLRQVGSFLRRGHDRMVVGFTTTFAISAYPTKVVSSNPAHSEVYSIQHYVIKFVSDFRQVGVFFWFPQPIKLTPRYN